MAKVLVVYATKCGTCGEIAEEVAKIIREAGAEVDVVRASKAPKLAGYDAVVLGTAIRMFKPLGEMRRFVSSRRSELTSKRVAVFSVGLAPKDDTPEAEAEATKFIAPLVEAVKPVIVAKFAGAIIPERLSFPFNRAAADPNGAMAAGDYRDWDAIRAWAVEAADALGVSSRGAGT
ncbi:MAG: flavodoxin domain-containing protein [Coriobacteriia bacterium]|nr:flavodoxin domain-containing protein [Coriobacteriia bacterium]